MQTSGVLKWQVSKNGVMGTGGGQGRALRRTRDGARARGRTEGGVFVGPIVYEVKREGKRWVCRVVTLSAEASGQESG